MQANLHLHHAKSVAKRFRTGISLHSHTCYSKETLGFVYRYAKDSGLLNWAIRRGERQFEARKGRKLDFAKAWWTPPVAPRDAWELEASQIREYGLDPIVSITDHDTITANLSLTEMPGFEDTAISLEWTVPYRGTFFHLGIHNLPKDRAAAWMQDLAACTANPLESTIGALLAELASLPGTLNIFNHPCWDEKNIGGSTHQNAVLDFIAAYGKWLHAVELNGLRPWKENRDVLALSRETGIPLISGGDRHGMEPNTVLNFTNAKSFSEFAAEVRDGHSEVALLPTYGHAFRLRILRDLQDILSDRPSHGMGWTRWEQRVFWENHLGEVQSLAQIFPEKTPIPVQVFVSAVAALRKPVFSGLVNHLWGQDDQVGLEPASVAMPVAAAEAARAA